MFVRILKGGQNGSNPPSEAGKVADTSDQMRPIADEWWDSSSLRKVTVLAGCSDAWASEKSRVLVHNLSCKRYARS